MICILALMSFAVLGIFSTKYRNLYKEAVTCLKNKIKGQHCPNYAIWKTKTLSKFEKHPKAFKFIGKNFDTITNTLVILMLLLFIVSGYFAASGLYSYAVYGNCNGPDSDGICILNPFAEKGCECGQTDCVQPCEGCGCADSTCNS